MKIHEKMTFTLGLVQMAGVAAVLLVGAWTIGDWLWSAAVRWITNG